MAQNAVLRFIANKKEISENMEEKNPEDDEEDDNPYNDFIDPYEGLEEELAMIGDDPKDPDKIIRRQQKIVDRLGKNLSRSMFKMQEFVNSQKKKTQFIANSEASGNLRKLLNRYEGVSKFRKEIKEFLELNKKTIE